MRRMLGFAPKASVGPRFSLTRWVPLTAMATALAIAALAIGSGCPKKKPEPPRRRVEKPKAFGSVRVSSKGAKLDKCKAGPGMSIVTLDLNRFFKLFQIDQIFA